MIVIDSSVWIDYFNGKDLPHTVKVDQVIGVREIFVLDLIMTEVLQGFRSKGDFESTREVLDAFGFVRTRSRPESVQAARNFIYLRSVGFTIRKTINTVIATTCILNGFELLHNDRDYTPFESHLGLRVVKY